MCAEGLCSRGREFESQHKLLDGYFHSNFSLKIVLFCLQGTESK